MTNRRVHVISALMVVMVAGSAPAVGHPLASGGQVRVGNQPEVSPDPLVSVELTDETGSRSPFAAHHGETADALVTPALGSTEFYVAGVTWDAGDSLPEGSEILLRTREDGGWSEWLSVDVQATPAGAPATGVTGTEPFITGGADAVQMRVTEGVGELPAHLSLTLIPVAPDASTTVSLSDYAPSGDTAQRVTQDVQADPEIIVDLDVTTEGTRQQPLPSGGVGGPGGTAVPFGIRPLVQENATAVDTAAVPTAATATTPAGTIITREGWGADEAYTDANWTPKYYPLDAAVVHHTAGTNTYTASQSAGIVKGIYVYHTVTRGWGDIGYNFLVDKYGQIFEGRKYSITSQPGTPAGYMIEAGHALGYNRGSLGISAMGNFDVTGAPSTSPIVTAMSRVISWKFNAAGINPSTRSSFLSPATRNTSTYPTGTALPRIFGHGDVAATACPGSALRAQLPALLSAVQNLYQPTTSPFTDITTSTPFYADMVWLANLKISTGFPDGTFRPSLPVNRDAMAAFLYRLAGSPAFTPPATSPFTDVTPATQFYKEITWLASRGITTGFADGSFQPWAPVNRDAMAAYLYRFAGKPTFTPPAVSPFSDISPQTMYYKEITWLASKGITTGYEDGTFRPWNAVNRDAMAAFLHRFASSGTTAANAIMGSSSLTAQQMAAYALSRNASPKIPIPMADLARIYLEEGAAEGVRGDVAFAQSLYETAYFAFGGRALPQWNNYCGLGVTGVAYDPATATETVFTTGVTVIRSASGESVGVKFSEPRLGVRAQIQHLKAYASTLPLTQGLVDPRFQYVTRGVAPTWEDLNGRWAVPGTTYGQQILSIYAAMSS